MGRSPSDDEKQKREQKAKKARELRRRYDLGDPDLRKRPGVKVSVITDTKTGKIIGEVLDIPGW